MPQFFKCVKTPVDIFIPYTVNNSVRPVIIWGVINLLEGYGQDNPASKSQGMKQLMAGGGVALIGITLVPLLSGLFG